MSIMLEVIAVTTEDAIAAQRGGADRLELVADLAVGGVTPALQVVRAVKQAVSIPVFVMIRPRSGSFVYSDAEVGTMVRRAREVKEAGADGIVVGALLEDGMIDAATVTRVAEAAGLPVTFHKAFDQLSTHTMPQALEQLAEMRMVERILTSGGSANAWDGRHVLADLVAHCRGAGRVERPDRPVPHDPDEGTADADNGGRSDRPDRPVLSIMPGGGVTLANAAQIVSETGVRQIHVGTAVRLPATPDGSVSEALVRDLKQRLQRDH